MSDMNRRQFLKQAALTGAGAALVSQNAQSQKVSPNDKLNIAVIGVSNRGGDNLNGVADQNIVAICDIDDNYLAQVKQRFPMTVTYNDFRKMLERKDLDAVVISTPDHMHAPATSAALHAGFHTYCEKPLTHTVEEARKIAELAKKQKRVTQMGTQIHATSNYRRVVELIKSGAIGEVREVHTWCGKVWSGSGSTPTFPPTPDSVHWDLWLGVAKPRPYSPAYMPANWRGWWAFGSGTLGDMACHHMDLPYWALDLRYPTRISAEGSPLDSEVTPEWLMVHYDYPARKDMPPVKLTWYNGNKRPPQFAEGKLPRWGDGNLFVGSKGMLLADYDRRVLLPEKDFADFVPPLQTIPDSIGHHKEWIEACKTGGPTTCNFDYSGALTEAVLLGNVAFRSGKTLEWDAKRLKAAHCPEADVLIRHSYRPGWSL